MKEVFKPINGYEGFYSVSNLGRVYSHSRKISGALSYSGFHYKKGKMITPQIGATGYPKATLSKNGIAKQENIHRLVALAFIPNPLNLPQVNHIDGNKANSTLTNLEWVSAKENANHAIQYLSSPNGFTGENNKSFKGWIIATNINTGEIIRMAGNKDIIKKGFHPGNVNSVLSGRYKTSKGHTFERESL